MHHLLFGGERRELRLLEQLGQALTAVELVLRYLVEIAAKLREGGEFAVLREIELQGSGHLPHRLDLRGAANAANGEADVHSWTHAGVEEIGFKVDLTVGDRNDVGRDVCRHVACLGLDDRQRGEGAAAVFVVHLGRALEQPRVKIEHVAGIRFAAWRTAQ